MKAQKMPIAIKKAEKVAIGTNKAKTNEAVKMNMRTKMK